MDTTAGRISITPTVTRQTPKNDFGQVLNNGMKGVLQAGAVVGSLTGMPIISGAVAAVSSLVNSTPCVTGGASKAVVSLGGSAGGISSVQGASGGGISLGSTVQTGGHAYGGSGTTGVEPAGMTDMLSSMRAEADRSMMVQLQMQNESREYNALTNILKLRHDSAKAAINNIR